MIYADYNGSALLCEDVREYLIKRIQEGTFSNPNAIHPDGRKLMFTIERSRASLAKNLGCKGSQIIFNSGASEGITQIFFSILGNCPSNGRNIIVTSGIEHPAVAQTCESYTKKGYELITIKTKNDGTIDTKHLKNLITNNKNKIAMITVMAANNETGIIQPFQEIGKMSQQEGIPYFSDTTQFIGKTSFNFKEANMDFAVISSHKIGALIGGGLVIAKDAGQLSPIILGGGQEKGLRGGTQNYICIETMAVAMKSFEKTKNRLSVISGLREIFEKNLKTKYSSAVIIGETSPRLATTTMVALPGLSSQSVQTELEFHDIYVTTSSACSDKKSEMSKTLKAMGTKPEVGLGVVRISLCTNASQECYDQIEKALFASYDKLLAANTDFDSEEKKQDQSSRA